MRPTTGSGPAGRLSAIVFACLLGWAAASCGASGSSEGAGADQTVVRVFGAASLTNAFQDLEAAFEAENPTYDVELNLAGSSSLRAQIVSGAPVDVFASANTEIMDEVVAIGSTVGEPAVFATNKLRIAVPLGNPAGLSGIEDFADESLFLGLCAETVPCGSLAEATLADADIEPSVDTREPDVRALLTKISAGELDGGIVYATDVDAAVGEVEGIDIPERFARSATYPIALLDQADAAEAGAAFVDFVLGPRGVQILADNGFATP